ncbi:Carbonic anhydrase [Trametes pubescens]|uniref:Carbonic anhydrase n=1 Tax=Trametes pubescens TaxID=154538 RepID=A0A1M2VT39_TRAPU|nr:Carbonic anhydrase [Trametes pubescens]
MPQEFVLTCLLAINKEWAAEFEKKHPGYLKAKSNKNPQTPHVLYIGCSDSRVPESVVLNAMPGEIFVHRNIANQFRLDDDSALSVLAFAVESLRVDHIIVAGHTGCGGVQTALDTAHPPPPLHAQMDTMSVDILRGKISADIG